MYSGNRKDENQKSIYILHTPDHYDCIKTIKAFFNTSYFCHYCKSPYDIAKGNHYCRENCKSCHRSNYNCFTSDESSLNIIKCEFCKNKCNSEFCYELHCKYVCRLAKTCTICKEVKKVHSVHICLNQKYCPNCKIAVDLQHQCYILTEGEKEQIINTKKKASKSIEQKDDNKNSNGLIFYDYEAFVNKKGVHEANLVVCSRVCKKCLNSQCCEDNCSIIHFENNEKFCQWLFSDFNDGFTAIAHNFKGFY